MPDNDFRRVLAAEGVSNFGAMLSRLAIPWLAALTLQATPLHMAALLVADVAAAAVAALPLGRWVDRSGKRAVMLLCDGARGGLLAVLALAAWRGWLTMPVLVAAAAASGVLTMGFELARSAWTAQCVAPADLPRRNAHLSTVGSLSETLAFALGGWLYQALGAALSLAVDALSYAVSALCLRGVREVHGAAPEAVATTAGRASTSAKTAWRTVLQESAEGLRAVAARPALRALAGVEVLLALGMSMAGTSYMIFVVRDLALPTGELGMIFALGGLGAVLGASLAPRLGRRFGSARAMLFGLVAAAVGVACVPMAGAGAGLAAWATLAWLVAHQIVGDAGHVLYDVHDRTLRQTAVPPTLLARADAGIRGMGQLATLAGALTGGLLGTAFGVRGVLWLVAATQLAAAVLVALRLAPLRLAPLVAHEPP